MERLAHNHQNDTNELLSAYIDNAVDVTERRQAEAQIQQCTACAQQAQQLRMFKQLLRELPNVQPRRSFTLDPAAVAPPRRLIFPVLRWATVVATALLFMVLSVDVLSSLGGPAASSGFAPGAGSTGAVEAFPAGNQEAGATGGGATGGGATGGDAASLAQPEASVAAEQMGDAAALEAPTPEMAAAGAAAAMSSAAAAGAAPQTGAADPVDAGSAQPPSTAAAAPAPDDSSGGSAEGGTAPSTAENSNNDALPPLAFDQAENAQRSNASGAATQPEAAQQPDAESPSTNEFAAKTVEARSENANWLSLRVAEIVLACIAVAFGAAAFWTWRRQV